MHTIGVCVGSLIALNALVFAALYTRKPRRELVERHLGWVLRDELDEAERQAAGRRAAAPHDASVPSSLGAWLGNADACGEPVGLASGRTAGDGPNGLG